MGPDEPVGPRSPARPEPLPRLGQTGAVPKTDVIFATTHGQTRRIAERIAAVLREQGHDVQTAEFGGSVRPDAESVVLGGPVYVGRVSPELCEWAKGRSQELEGRAIAFFTVSLSAADKRDTARTEDARLIQEAVSEAGLRPDYVASIAGSLDYTKYGFFKRMLMKRISRTAGGPLDTSRDHEMTDWSQVEAFSRAIASRDGTSPFSTKDRPLASTPI